MWWMKEDTFEQDIRERLRKLGVTAPFESISLPLSGLEDHWVNKPRPPLTGFEQFKKWLGFKVRTVLYDSERDTLIKLEQQALWRQANPSPKLPRGEEPWTDEECRAACERWVKHRYCQNDDMLWGDGERYQDKVNTTMDFCYGMRSAAEERLAKQKRQKKTPDATNAPG